MIKWILQYVIAREVYNQYQENRTFIAEQFSLEKLGNLSWNIIFIAIVIAISFNFTTKNDLKVSQISNGDQLYLNHWESIWNNEVPIYHWTIKENLYKPKNNGQNLDTVFNYTKAINLDSIPVTEDFILGTSNDNSIQTEEGTFVELELADNIKLVDPKGPDISFDKDSSYSDAGFVQLEHIRLSSTKRPEDRWLSHFLALLICVFAIRKIIIALLRLLKKKIPVYEREPVKKKDNRFKSGERIVRYKTIIKEYREMTPEELTTHKKQQISRIIISGIFLIGSFAVLIWLYK